MKANLLRAFFLAALSALLAPTLAAQADRPPESSKESRECMSCHKKEHRGIYQQWGASKHYRANVGCYECHAAEKSDKDAFNHYDTHDRGHRHAEGLRPLPPEGGEGVRELPPRQGRPHPRLTRQRPRGGRRGQSGDDHAGVPER